MRFGMMTSIAYVKMSTCKTDVCICGRTCGSRVIFLTNCYGVFGLLFNLNYCKISGRPKLWKHSRGGCICSKDCLHRE